MQLVKIGFIRDIEFCIEFDENCLDGVDLPVGEVLVGSEKVLEKGNMLRQPRYTAVFLWLVIGRLVIESAFTLVL